MSTHNLCFEQECKKNIRIFTPTRRFAKKKKKSAKVDMIHYEFVYLQVCHWQTQLQMIHVTL